MSVWGGYFCAHNVLYGKRCDRCPDKRAVSDSHRLERAAHWRREQIGSGWDADGRPVEAP